MKVKFWDDIDPVQAEIDWNRSWKAARTVTFDQPLTAECFEALRKSMESQRLQEEEIWIWRREWEEFVKLCKEAGID